MKQTLRKSLYYLFIPLLQPAERIRQLTRDADRVRYASLLLFCTAVLYTFTVFVLFVREFPTAVEPFLRISANNYYFYELFFTLPLFFLLVILYAGTARLIAVFLGGNGSFLDLYSFYGIVIVLPLLLTMWIPETLLALTAEPPDESISLIPAWIDIPRQLIGVLWPLVVTVIGIRVIEALSWLKSCVITLVAFVPYAIMMLVFIR
jgi:hypothetical protein